MSTDLRPTDARHLAPPLLGLVATWSAGLAGLWGLAEGFLEAFTLVVGAVIGVLTVVRLVRELRRPAHP